MGISAEEPLMQQIRAAQFFMLRYETEFTPCTGITAVTRQERRHFKGGVMLAPWCPNLKRSNPQDDPLTNGSLRKTQWKLKVHGLDCRVLTSTDANAPLLFLAVEGRFNGMATPYDLPLTELKTDSFYFALAVQELLKQAARPQQFVWGGDWETVPALWLLCDHHRTALTLHNTFDECLADESQQFGGTFVAFAEKRGTSPFQKTVLEIGLETVDVVTTVNRGFAWGMRHEPIQTRVMAQHLQHLLGRVTGINNAAFSPLNESLKQLGELYRSDPSAGRRELFERQAKAREALPPEMREHLARKVLVVSMGRRVAQKQHDLLVESTRMLLRNDPDLPLFVYFATTPGDPGSAARQQRIADLQAEFPRNTAFVDGRISNFEALMQAADYNCMPSLYEPHGGAYEGTVVPIARAVDGLAEQICAWKPRGRARRMNRLWHERPEAPTGLLFREGGLPSTPGRLRDLRALLSESPSPENDLFRAMRDELTKILIRAVDLRLQAPEEYAALAMACLARQQTGTWQDNLNALLVLMEDAQVRNGS